MVIDFKGSIDGAEFDGGAAEDFPLVLGSGGFIPGFEEQLVGVKAGDELEVKVTFPEAYGAKHLAGKEASFAVTVKAVKAPKPAEIDDALAKRFGAETLDALKEQIRGRLGDEYAQASRAILKRRLMDALDELVSFELPPTLVDVEANQIAHQLWHEEHPDHHGHDHGEIEPTDEHRRLAERRVRLGLLLAELGTKHDDHRARPGDAAGAVRAGAAVPGPGAAVPRVRAEEPAGAAADPRAALRGEGRRLHPRARAAEREAGAARTSCRRRSRRWTRRASPRRCPRRTRRRPPEAGAEPWPRFCPRVDNGHVFEIVRFSARR